MSLSVLWVIYLCLLHCRRLLILPACEIAVLFFYSRSVRLCSPCSSFQHFTAILQHVLICYWLAFSYLFLYLYMSSCMRFSDWIILFVIILLHSFKFYIKPRVILTTLTFSLAVHLFLHILLHIGLLELSFLWLHPTQFTFNPHFALPPRSIIDMYTLHGSGTKRNLHFLIDYETWTAELDLLLQASII